jgi:hypothetical protein
MKEKIERFSGLFVGNPRSYGVFNPKTGKMHTERSAIGFEQYEKHLSGEEGVGVVPVLDDGNCWFGAIDIDAHGDSPDIDLLELEKAVKQNDLPLTICRSKSGGAHLYLFMTDPTPAKVVRQALAKWAGLVGYPGVEIFPKQDNLPESGGERQLGNWLNLCCFDADSPNELRYCFEGGQKVPFAYFLSLAESRRVKPAILIEKTDGEHGEAPPCIQRMLVDGVGRGHRNEALYNLVIYFKKAFPETWKDRAFDANARIFEKPLVHSEAKRTITSASRREYRYKCKEEPCRSLCNSSLCVKRKFGITPEEKGELELGKPPEFGKLEKYTTEPVRWVLYVDDTPVTLATHELMDYKAVRRAVADNLTKIIAPMKNDKWEATLCSLMEKAIILEAPEEASAYGFIRERLFEFFGRADLSSGGEDITERRALLLGSPVVQKVDGKRVVYFRGSDFIDFLKKNRSEELKGSNLWMALRKVGVEHAKLRVESSVISVWFAPLNDGDVIDLEPVRVEPEL